MAVTNFFWDEQNLLQEYDVAGVTIAHYVTEPNQYGNVISQRSSGQASYFHFDAIGSTTELTSITGTTTDSNRYSAFGTIVAQTGPNVIPFRFVGRTQYFHDSEVSCHYVRRRLYSPDIARWMSVDSYDVLYNRVNLYCYVANSPSGNTDSSGLFGDVCPAVQAVCIVGGLGYRYGNYCGLTKVGPGPPIDCVDAACAAHDAALPDLATLCNPWLRKPAHARLCAAVVACGAPGGGCWTLPTVSARMWCLQAASAVGNYACASATPVGW